MAITSVKIATIYHDGKSLKIELEYHKTIVKVYVMDMRKAFPIVAEFKYRCGGTHPGLLAREDCIKQGLFK